MSFESQYGENGIHNMDDLCLALERAGCDKGFQQLQMNNGAFVSTFLEFADNNPGVIGAICDWIDEHDIFDDYDEDDEDDEDEEYEGI